ncbi:nitrite reductase small subunit NirD [Oryzifoliimicrobium ureilyticus]|uniref:nitrite reductase small subunit NirD n=1 Tax=Oryzifoliimicrobium ureilyticus TaxID=3113724 RepID=UPI0030767FA5
MQWVAIGHIDDIPLRGARCIKTPMANIAVFRTAANEVYAIENRCPHKGGPLSEGIVHGRSVTCPLHNWNISLENGEALGADEGQVQSFPVHLENGYLSISLENLHLEAAE